ncbi:hypothetical protein FE845_18325 [Marinobacter sp. 1-4A]|uniref:hypothetical protein n=1 Tax=Marinobacter sp. 1-4A TaxID=2582919 RepID=UPI0019082484|nr:hypothetical protein [Marinobacter sp. 1-4A]MBK1853308.1 hypothetical protein [Marinobacter sp. 1-4A]
MSQLSITIDLDDDGSAGLSGRFASQGFSGFGEGWFNLSEIREFCNGFEKLASTLEGETELIAGQSKVDGTDYLERFGLRCYVVAKTGILGVHVTLSEYPYTDCRPQEISMVSGELKVEIQSAINFIQGLRSLCSGSVAEAILVGRQ